MSEWFKEPVLKTGDSSEPWVRIPLSPPLSASKICLQKYPRGRRGSPAKGVGGLNRARVQIPPSAPTKSRFQNESGTFVYPSQNKTHPVFLRHFQLAFLCCKFRTARWRRSPFFFQPHHPILHHRVKNRTKRHPLGSDWRLVRFVFCSQAAGDSFPKIPSSSFI